MDLKQKKFFFNISKPFTSKSFSILLVSFRIWKFVGITSAKADSRGFENKSDRDCYHTGKGFAQMLICIPHLSSIFVKFLEISKLLGHTKASSNLYGTIVSGYVLYFEIIRSMLELSINLLTFWIFIVKRKRLSRFLNFIGQREYSISDKNGINVCKILVAIICTVPPFYSLWNFVGKTRYAGIRGLGKLFEKQLLSLDFIENGVIREIVGFLLLLAYVFQSYIHWTCLCVAFVATVFLYKLSDDILMWIENEKPQVHLVFDAYRLLSQVAEDLNKHFSLYIGCLSCLAVVHFSRFLDAILDAGLGKQTVVLFVIQLTWVLSIWGLSGHSYVKIQEISTLIFKRRNDLVLLSGGKQSCSICDVGVFLNELYQNPCGLKAFTFNMNYSFMLTLLGSCLSYTILLLQMKN